MIGRLLANGLGILALLAVLERAVAALRSDRTATSAGSTRSAGTCVTTAPRDAASSAIGSGSLGRAAGACEQDEGYAQRHQAIHVSTIGWCCAGSADEQVMELQPSPEASW